ncbi:MAG: hypothetical protein COC10_09680 [Sphingobium sp.]|nr:MAG: hypothetical protein COC10_09680 [Sphingobium sp.]
MTDPILLRAQTAAELAKIITPAKLKPAEIQPIATALIDLLAAVLACSPATTEGGAGDVASAVSNRILSRIFAERLRVGELLDLSAGGRENVH